MDESFAVTTRADASEPSVVVESELSTTPTDAAASTPSEIRFSYEQWLLYARDLRQAVAELEVKEAQRKALLEKLISAQEDERKRIALDIHDEVLQILGFNLMKIDLIERLWEQNRLDEAITHLRGLRDTIENSVNVLREIIADIRPPSLDVQGLLPTLDDYLNRLRADTGIHVTLNSELGRRQSPAVETLVYRLVQEALVNVRKHANATRVAVWLAARDGMIHVTIEDDGRGFNVEEAMRQSLARGSLGLHSIKERVELAGGSLSIESEIGAGCTIRFSVPSH
ncbi:MAG: sensor histidine kinase [Dehalococcoidia bacterium]|nr:sensor histidine kinase [Dehalococcoidia bacterium]